MKMNSFLEKKVRKNNFMKTKRQKLDIKLKKFQIEID